MNAIEFVKKIQAYYGEYPKGQMAEIANYLRGKRETLLSELYKQCIKNFSSKWKTAPDVAVFEEYLPEALKLEVRASGQLQIDEDYVSKEEGLQFLSDLLSGLNKKSSTNKYSRYSCNFECGKGISYPETCNNKDCQHINKSKKAKPTDDYEDILF